VSHEMFLAEDFHGNADNIYEAIVAIARRARQIGEEQRREMDAYLSQVEMLEKFTEDEENYDEPVRQHEPVLQFEKPTILSLREMIAEKLDLMRPELTKEEAEAIAGFTSGPVETESVGGFGGKLDLSEE
jgi:hypothetical protein